MSARDSLEHFKNTALRDFIEEAEKSALIVDTVLHHHDINPKHKKAHEKCRRALARFVLRMAMYSGELEEMMIELSRVSGCNLEKKMVAGEWESCKADPLIFDLYRIDRKAAVALAISLLKESRSQEYSQQESESSYYNSAAVEILDREDCKKGKVFDPMSDEEHAPKL